MIKEVDGAAIFAHDFKEPLADLRQLGLLLDGERDADTIDSISTQIVKTSESALRRINDLARISRLEGGLFVLEPVSVRGVCEDVYRNLSPNFNTKGRTLNLCYRNRARLAVASSELLYSVIYNFCSNAMYYSDQGTESTLSVTDEKGHIRIAVRDYGPALPTEVWRKISAGALDAPTRISARPEGSGVGLYVASKFAEHMHAHLGAVRHRDGTSFFIDLLVSRQASLFYD